MIALDQSTVNSLALIGAGLVLAYNTAKSAKRDKKIDEVKETTDAVHILTNSQMGSQLLEKLQLTEELSVFAHHAADRGTPADVAAAVAIDVRVLARKQEYQDHLIRQAKVDADVAAAKKK